MWRHLRNWQLRFCYLSLIIPTKTNICCTNCNNQYHLLNQYRLWNQHHLCNQHHLRNYFTPSLWRMNKYQSINQSVGFMNPVSYVKSAILVKPTLFVKPAWFVSSTPFVKAVLSLEFETMKSKIPITTIDDKICLNLIVNTQKIYGTHVQS